MKRPKYALVLAVVPWYRQQCVEVLRSKLGPELSIFAADFSLDPTVKTGISREYYTRLRRVSLFGSRMFAHTIPLAAIRATVCVVDLNPRSLSAWALLLIRRAAGRRVLVWGHLHPRRGRSSPTAVLRRLMRRLSNGTILYGYDSVSAARSELPTGKVWVAPNALYRADDMKLSPNDARHDYLYVGRLEPEKNVDQLIDGFYLSRAWERGAILRIVGAGSLESQMREAVDRLGLGHFVHIYGQINATETIRNLYSTVAASLSPGYVGLSATQSLGFGVPMIYAEHEDHAPEVELARFGGMAAYSPSTVEALGMAIRSFESTGTSEIGASLELARTTRKYYSAETMASGLRAALDGSEVTFDVHGWLVEEPA